MKAHFVIINHVEELPRLAEKIEALSEKWELPLPLSMNLNLVLEELISNIIFYGFNDSQTHKIDLSLQLEGRQLRIVVADDGIPFDPTKREEPDITLPIEDRPIGGLGIYLVSKIMDTVSYQREQERNILTLEKNLEK